MIRGDNVLCGTTTTSTGTLTLAAVPEPPGALDFDTWLRATGVGMGNSAAVPVSYTINEYTDATFATIKGSEKGVGLLTLGGSAGIANCTLVRTTSQYKVTGMDGTTPALTFGSAYSIGTAANTLVIIGPSATEVPAYHPYYDTQGDTNWGVFPDGMDHLASLGTVVGSTSTVRGWHQPFRWSVPMLVKRCTFRVQTFTAPTPASVVYVRLYAARASDGRPGKLLYDFNSSGVSVTSTGNFSTGAAGNGFFLEPGDYWIEFCFNAQSTSGNIALSGPSAPYYGANPAVTRMGATAGQNYAGAEVTGTTGAAPDPAVLTSWLAIAYSSLPPVAFGFSPS